jgi:hypothetical protein
MMPNSLPLAATLALAAGLTLHAQAPQLPRLRGGTGGGVRPSFGQGGGQRGGQAPAPSNLQVLPKDISRADLTATMRGFTQALGVQCNYCHVAEGRGGRNDMASDEKPTKQTARVMIQLVDHVNEMLASNLKKPAGEIQKIQCATCHRGSAIPTVEAPAPADAR